MSVRRILPRLLKILHSVTTRVPKIVLPRAEDLFPALPTSMVKFCGHVYCQEVLVLQRSYTFKTTVLG
jgi:hypothetical protein